MQKFFQRTLATASASARTPLVKIPVTLHGIDGRYATALYSAASKSKTLDQVESELKKIQTNVRKDPQLKQFLKNPTLTRDQKAAGVSQMLQKYSEVTRNFFTLLAENCRLEETEKIIDAYMTLMSAHRGEVSVTVTTAKTLDAKLQSQLTKVLGKSSIVNSKPESLKITSKVDPSIVGGIIVEIGDKTIDLSISSRLAKLNKLITDSV